MKFSAQLPTDRVDAGPELLSARAIGELARALEDAGFDAGYVTEHPFPPDDWLASGGHHALDPFVALAAAAAATERLRLHTNILVLPYRNPFLTAKAVASLDVVSGGRVLMGVAAGYLEGEYDALGADFVHRNGVTDEALVAIVRAWREDGLRLEGARFRADGNTMRPRPVQAPHPPIWVGGNTRRAMQRAVAFGQGWSPFPVPKSFAGRTRTASLESVEELGAKIALLGELAAAAGRAEPIDVNFVPFGVRMGASALDDADGLCEQLERLAAVGVTWVSVGVPAKSRKGYREEAARFGEQIIARMS